MKLKNINIKSQPSQILVKFYWITQARLTDDHTVISCEINILPQEYSNEHGQLLTMIADVMYNNTTLINYKVCNQHNLIELCKTAWVTNSKEDISITLNAFGKLWGPVCSARLITELSEALIILSDNTVLKNAVDDILKQFEVIRMLSK